MIDKPKKSNESKRLGRGLSSLLGEVPVTPNPPAGKANPPSQIPPHRHLLRKKAKFILCP